MVRRVPIQKEKKKWQPPAPTRVGKKKKKVKGSSVGAKLPNSAFAFIICIPFDEFSRPFELYRAVMPSTKCRLRELRLERVKDYLLLEQEFIANQESHKPSEEKAEAEKNKVEELRGSPLSVGTLEEIIDDNHAIVSTQHGPEYYVGICSFVDKDQIEPGCSVLLHNKVMAVVGLLTDDVDPLISVMKVEKAPLESYADIGGLEAQIQEVKVCGLYLNFSKRILY
jgi:26S proteasome regulatory subunit T2